jgi:hypothetical protein
MAARGASGTAALRWPSAHRGMGMVAVGWAWRGAERSVERVEEKGPFALSMSCGRG